MEETKLILRKEILAGQYLVVEEYDYQNNPVRTFIMPRHKATIQ